MRWLGFHFVTRPNLFVLWYCWDGLSSNKMTRKGLRLIWHAVVWSIWKALNDRVFNNSTADVEEVVEAIKVLSWRRCLSRLPGPACLFYDWHWNSKDCLLQ